MSMWMGTERFAKCPAFANAVAYSYGYGGQAEVRRRRRDEPEGRRLLRSSTPGWSHRLAEPSRLKALGDS